MRRALGVEMQKGGEHALMGTHNFLLRLGEKLYLEVIAANPAAPHPGRPRWFQLDEPDSVRSPRLATWVARCDDIYAAPKSLGTIVAMRRGNFEWLITIPEDGQLSLGGLVPALMEWRSSAHPADTLNDPGCSLLWLEGVHPEPAKVKQMLKAIGFEGKFAVSRGNDPKLVAHIRTPGGERLLD